MSQPPKTLSIVNMSTFGNCAAWPVESSVARIAAENWWRGCQAAQEPSLPSELIWLMADPAGQLSATLACTTLESTLNCVPVKTRPLPAV